MNIWSEFGNANLKVTIFTNHYGPFFTYFSATPLGNNAPNQYDFHVTQKVECNLANTMPCLHISHFLSCLEHSRAKNEVTPYTKRAKP